MRGRPPKPTAVKAAEGNPGKRPLNRGELQEPSKAPRCPRFLDKEGRRLWRQLSAILLRRRVIREEDQMMLANLCQAWSTLQLAYKQLAAKPEKTRLTRKDGVRNPLLLIIRDQVQIINSIGARFGFSPADRARLAFDEPDVPATADMEQLIGGPAEHDEHDLVM